MRKLLVFDLDGTLCPYNGPMKNEDIIALRELESAGYKIAICSGKSNYYLCGFARQLGLKQLVLAGENGAIIQLGIVMPNNDRYFCPVSDDAKKQLKQVSTQINQACGSNEIWYQPNEVQVTVFGENKMILDKIAEAISSLDLDDLNVFRFEDCYDFVPKSVSKGNAVRCISELMDIKLTDVVAFGDSENDLSMFDVAGVSVKIGSKLECDADYSFDDLSSALATIAKMKNK